MLQLSFPLQSSIPIVDGLVLLLHLGTIFAGGFAFEVAFNVLHSVQL
jgi:hypothetical protein